MEHDPPTADTHTLRGLGVTAEKNAVLLYFRKEGVPFSLFRTASANGFDFAKESLPVFIKDRQRRSIDVQKIQELRISPFKKTYIATYLYSGRHHPVLFGATSNNLTDWLRTGAIGEIGDIGIVVPNYKYQKKYVLLSGDRSIRMGFSPDLASWDLSEEPVLEPRRDQWGELTLRPATVITVPEGIVLIYYARGESPEGARYSLHAVLLDTNNPRRILWQSDTIWEQTNDWSGEDVTPIGAVYFQNRLISYWNARAGVFAIPHAPFKYLGDRERSIPNIILKRFSDNPIIRPIAEHFWESKATFNPGAVYLNNKVHLVYRAIGDDDSSVFGYAAASDGVHIDERSDEPAYVPSAPFEKAGTSRYMPSGLYASGGGVYGGCEDPRLTRIGDTLYMTYVAHNGSSAPRVALTSISVTDFLNKKWNWSESVMITAPGVVNKNAAIFPEKINGKYAIFHRVFPNILLDYVDDLTFDGTQYLRSVHTIRPTRTAWDSRKVGAGAPPIRTDAGWLLIYHAVGEQDPSRYKIGAMLLDLNDPSRVLFRSTRPILAPDVGYENDGFKAGVAYPCGAVVAGENLHVYYGGADTVTCVASANLTSFLGDLMESGAAQLTPISSRL